MEELTFTNRTNDTVYYLKWAAEEPEAAVVISHGMAEHPERYDDLARFLNENGLSVCAVYHIGHGKFAEKAGHMQQGDFDKCVSNIAELVGIAREETGRGVFLLGHSMGSFLSQLYIERYHNLQGLILSGSSNATATMKMGKTIAGMVCAFSRDTSRPSPFMNKLSFSAYNKVFKDAKTEFDWLNRDEQEVEKYINDPLCGFVCSQSFFREMTRGLSTMGRPEELAKIDRKLPILIHGGTMDPVGECGKGLKALEKQYKDLGMKEVELILYPDARHEIYNELNKEEVYRNTLEFIEAYK